jgi:hypothetical protein
MSMLVKPNVMMCIALLVGCGALVCCGGSKSSLQSSPIPNIAGSWELIASSSNGSLFGIEVALTEGQALVNGFNQPDGQISANSAQIAFVTLDPANASITGFGGDCLPITSGNSLGPGSVTALSAPINFTFTENGNVFNATGTISGDGSTIVGTYVPQSGNTCSDPGGTINGTVVSKFSGTYLGMMCPPSSSSCQNSADFTDSVTATLTENSSSVLTVNLVLSGADNATFTLTGPVTGKAFSLQGTFQGQTLIYYGYSEIVSNVQSVYLVNATSPGEPLYVGTLSVPQ